MVNKNSFYNIARFAFRVFVIVLCLALCLVPTFNRVSAVQAGATIAIAGGAIGTGGLPALGALGSLLVPTLGVIGAVLLGAGVNVYITEQSAAAGMTKTQFIETSLRQWVSERGGSFDDLISTIAAGIHVSPLGQVSITGAAGALIYQFGNWLFANDFVNAPSSGVDSATTTVLDVPFAVNFCDFSFSYTYNGQVETVQYICEKVSGSSDVLFTSIYDSVDVSSRSVKAICSKSGASVKVTRYINGVFNFTQNYSSLDGWTSNNAYFDLSVGSVSSNYNPVISTNVPFSGLQNNEFVEKFAYNNINWGDLVIDNGGTLPSDDVFTGAEQDWLDNRDLLKPGDGDVVTLQNAPDLIGGAVDALTSGAYTVSVPDYLTALSDAYNSALASEASVPLTLTDTATGAIVTEDVSVASPFDDVALTSSVAPTDTAGALVAPDVSVGADDAVGIMTPDLTTIFPFCIPFDLARVLNLLAADPVIPQYHVRWEVPYFEDPIEFDINLTPLDGVMAVARTMETLAFVVGLALSTRQMYLRG